MYTLSDLLSDLGRKLFRGHAHLRPSPFASDAAGASLRVSVEDSGDLQYSSWPCQRPLCAPSRARDSSVEDASLIHRPPLPAAQHCEYPFGG